MKKFSFIIPVYKTAKFLKRCILSIKEQDYPEWEAIIIIDGPDTEAKNIVGEFIEMDLRNNIKGRFRSYEFSENKGAPAARNFGAKLAIGDYLVLFDSDCSLYPGMLRIWAEAFEDHPECDFVYGGYRFYGDALYSYPSMEFDPYMLEINNYIATMFPMRREVYPGQNEKLKSLQDWDMWLRLVKDQGRKGFYLGEVCFITEQPESGMITMDSHKNWLVRTKEVKKLHNISNKKICVSSFAAPYQTIQRAKVLDADFKNELLMMKPHEYKLILLFGYFLVASDTGQPVVDIHTELLKQSIKSKGCKRAIQWIGTDVFQMQGLPWYAHKQLTDALKTIDYHFCNSTWLQDELATMGIDAKVNYCPIFESERFQPKPLPEKFTVGVYHSQTNKMHNDAFLIDIAKAMPDIEFKFFGPSMKEPKTKNIEIMGWQKDITKVIEQCSINVRMTVHDGFPHTPIHFMLMGRRVITNVKMPFVDYINLMPSPQNYINAKADMIQFIRKIKKEKPWGKKKTKEVREHYLKLCSPEKFRRRIYQCIKGVK